MKRRPFHDELTGDIRFRQNWRGRMIMQVQVWDSKWLGEVVWFKRWRDGKLGDLKTGSLYGNTGSTVFLRVPDDRRRTEQSES